MFVSPVRVDACRACFPLPKKTVADFLIESEFVVFARESQAQPFTYSTIAILKGETAPKNIDLFVNSTTRRILKSNPKHAVVLVRKSNQDSWQSLGVADGQFQEVVKRILAHSGEWTGEKGLNERYKFFLSLLGHQNRNLHELAYLEMGRAPYRTIKKMAKFVSQDDIRSMLLRREYFEWRSLAILMVSQNPNDQDRKLIEESFQSCHRFSLTTNLTAWATAYIELHGINAIDEIDEVYLSNPERTADEIRTVLIALSIHGQNDNNKLRDRIVESYGVALGKHPEMVGLIVNDLSVWKTTKYRDKVMKIARNRNLGFDRQVVTAIQRYVE